MLTFLCGTVSAAEIVEAVVARVGDRIVTRSQYVQRLREGFEEIDHNSPPDQAKSEKTNYKKTCSRTCSMSSS